MIPTCSALDLYYTFVFQLIEKNVLILYADKKTEDNLAWQPSLSLSRQFRIGRDIKELHKLIDM